MRKECCKHCHCSAGTARFEQREKACVATDKFVREEKGRGPPWPVIKYTRWHHWSHTAEYQTKMAGINDFHAAPRETSSRERWPISAIRDRWGRHWVIWMHSNVLSSCQRPITRVLWGRSMSAYGQPAWNEVSRTEPKGEGKENVDRNTFMLYQPLMCELQGHSLQKLAYITPNATVYWHLGQLMVTQSGECMRESWYR